MLQALGCGWDSKLETKKNFKIGKNDSSTENDTTPQKLDFWNYLQIRFTLFSFFCLWTILFILRPIVPQVLSILWFINSLLPSCPASAPWAATPDAPARILQSLTLLNLSFTLLLISILQKPHSLLFCFFPELPAIAGATPKLGLTGSSTNLRCSTSTWPHWCSTILSSLHMTPGVFNMVTFPQASVWA